MKVTMTNKWLDIQKEVLENIQLDSEGFNHYLFYLEPRHEGSYLIGRYLEPDIVTGEETVQSTRKWYLSKHATRSEIAQTVLKCVLTSAEHRVREGFKYKGKRVFGPHFDIEALVSICGELDYRASHKQDGNEL